MKKCPDCNEYLSDDAIQCKSCGNFLDGKPRAPYRCDCGNLLAKMTGKTIEIKCRRCKRIHVLKLVDFKDQFNSLLEERGEDEHGQVDLRCQCGNLLAKLTDDSFFIRCRRCKRTEKFPIALVPEFHERNVGEN